MRITTLLFTIFLLVGCANTAPEPLAANPAKPPAKAASLAPLPDRDPQLAKTLVSEGAVLLDVRSQEEWDEKHLEGATLIPVDELDGRIGELDKLTAGDKNKPIVVYCRSGGRAGRAKTQLEAAGYTQVTNMGGITDWPEDK